MNFKQKQELIKKVSDLFIRNYPQGTVKITSGESRTHRQVKADVCGWLKDNGWDFWTEPNIIGNKNRPDIMAIHYLSSMAIIIEIIASEKESSLLQKQDRYPKEFQFIKVYCKDFNYDTFSI